MVGQHEHRRAVRGFVAPPPCPALVPCAIAAASSEIDRLQVTMLMLLLTSADGETNRSER
jgi:hypothetical protein